MGSKAVVIVDPGLQVVISLVGVGPVFCIGPFTQSGLDEALGLAVGSGCVWPGAAVPDSQMLASMTELP